MVPDVPARYRIDSLLGRGANGSTWRAFDRLHEQTVALKVMPAYPEVRREIAVLRRLRLVGTPRLFDHGSCPTGVYIAMELATGSPFPGPGGLTAELVAALLEILRRVHAQGIIHGDLKPENVLVSGVAPVVLDFGCAGGRWLPPDTLISGTPNFMSPGRLRGEPLEPRDDLYALGLMVAVAATGELPLAGRDWTELCLVRASTALDPPPQLAEPLATLVRRAVNPRSAETADALLELFRPVEPVVGDAPGATRFVGPERVFRARTRANEALQRAGSAWKDELLAWERAGLVVRGAEQWLVEPSHLARIELRPLRAPADWQESTEHLVATGRSDVAAERVAGALSEPSDEPTRRSLLQQAVALGFERGTERALEEAEYELSRAPTAHPDLDRLVAGGLAGFRGRPKEAIDLLRSCSFDDPNLGFWAAAAQVTAARALSADTERSVLARLESSANERVAGSLAAWRGWLAYRVGDYASASRILQESARTRSRLPDRCSDLLMAASAALEACEHATAVELARLAEAETRRATFPLFALRAEWIVRAVGFRSGLPSPPDLELVEIAARLELAHLEGLVALTEAAFADRAGDAVLARELALRAHTAWVRSRSGGAPLARALAVACGAVAGAEELVALVGVAEVLPPEVGAQVLLLVGRHPDAPADWRARYRATAAKLGADCFGRPLDVVALPRSL